RARGQRGDPGRGSGPDGRRDAARRGGGLAGGAGGADSAAFPRVGLDPRRGTTGAVTGQIPSVVVLTDRRLARRPLVDVIRDAVDGGARWVVLRERDLPRARRAALAAELREVLAPVGGLLIVS